jgi:hypothetical protein
VTTRPTHTLSIAAGDSPPPPLAGALAAWWRREGYDVRIVRGPAAAPELWVHLEGEPADDRFDGLDSDDLHFFGPGVDDPVVRDAIRRRYPTADLVRGDPEPGMSDLTTLPITTWAGFEPLGGAFRLLGSRGPRARKVAAVVAEVVYLVETHGAGHLLFDDANLGTFPGWLEAFEDEIAHLPWDLTWEANVHGERTSGRTDRGRLP